VFEGYVAARYWYFNVEAGLGFAAGVVMGAAYRDAASNPCAVWADWLLVALGVVEVVLGAALLRPFAVPLDAVCVAVTAGLSTLSQLLPLVSSGDASIDAADALGVAGCAVQLAVLVLSVAVAVVTGRPWRSVGTRQDAPRQLLRGECRSEERSRPAWSEPRKTEPRVGRRQDDALVRGRPQQHDHDTQQERLCALIETICTTVDDRPAQVSR
jgi:hypothetical protein